MNDHNQPPVPTDPVDELVDELLDCGAVLSQIISHMVRTQEAGHCPPDIAPIPEVAHSMLYGVLRDLRKQYSRRDIHTASAIVGKATEAIAAGVFMVNLDMN